MAIGALMYWGLPVHYV